MNPLRFLPLSLLLPIQVLANPEPLFIDDPSRLGRLEEQGFDLGRVALGTESRPSNNQVLLAQSQRYRSLVESLKEDLRKINQADPLLTASMRSPHRLFDIRWLQSADAQFELVGIVNRADRASFHPGTCGEIRLIYRLAYRKNAAKIYSRLPLTVNAVFWARSDRSCTGEPERWFKFLENTGNLQGKKPTPRDLGLSNERLKSVEVNLQSVRWPSTVRPDMGGYAEYLLRVFQPRGSDLVVSELENTPDLEKSKKDPTFKKRLLAWIKTPKNLESLDQGIARIPDEFLATRATSVALHGGHRLANAPFSQLFSGKDFKDVDFTKSLSFRSPLGLLRRLNDLSCTGCHQGRTVAGFHFLGRDPADTDAVNSIFVSSSPHFLSDQPRRQAFVENLRAGKPPLAFRPISVRSEKEPGTFGAHCGLGDPSFASWTCAPGYECRPEIHDPQISPTGVCEPKEPTAGSGCRPGRMVAQNDPHRDRVILLPSRSCGANRVCEETSVGFPGGMCAASGCSNLRPGETCGSIAILQEFNDCLARRKDPFAKCLGDNVRPATMRSCSTTSPCRDDYICARTSGGQGACIPPYFLFQLRVDGHPAPG